MNLLRIVDGLPDLWNRTFGGILIVLAVISTALMCLRDGNGSWALAAMALVAVVFAYVAWYRLAATTRSAGGYALLALSIVLVVAGAVLGEVTPLGWIVLLALLTLIAVCGSLRFGPHITGLLIEPLLVSGAFIGAAAFMGHPARGAFLAAFAFMLGVSAGVSRDVERRVSASEERNDTPPFQTAHRGALGFVSTVLFVFGVVALWPWLAQTHGLTYLWMLIIGVYAPMLYFWGRLRQPNRSAAVAALRRFNHVLPYLGLILLLAFVIG